MNHRTPQRTTRPALWLVLMLVGVFAMLPTFGDVVQTIDQDDRLGGTATIAPDDDALTLTDEQGNTQRIKLTDLDRVRFNIDLAPERQDKELLINNDRGTGTRQKQNTLKLRKGLHRITLPYWQGKGNHKLELYVTGPGLNNQVQLGSEHLRCFRNTKDEPDAIATKDEQGYRLPELSLDNAGNRRRMLTRARYRLYTSEEDSLAPTSVGGLAGMVLKRSGTTSTVNTGMLNRNNENVGLIFDAFFIAKEDGPYTFTLLSDDGSQLYFGQIEHFSGDALNEKPVKAPWRIQLAHDGVARGELKTIADESLTLHLPLISDATIALSHVRSVWDKKLDLSTINRTNEPGNQDTVYLRDRNDPEQIRSVSGKVLSLDDSALTFAFRGEERTITRSRIVGLVFRHADRPAPKAPGTHHVVEVVGGQVLPGRINQINTHASIELFGGGTLTPPREVLRSLRIANGRRIDLTRVAPNAEEAIPYFGLKLPYKLNTNFSGKPIVLFDEKTYPRGLAVHSKSRLHYRLRPNCERFEATFGLMDPGGKLGNVTARVLGDGEVLWEQADITAQTKAVDISVALQGVERLILEVDFGQGQNVGDRAAWCNPRLIYGSAAKDQP